MFFDKASAVKRYSRAPISDRKYPINALFQQATLIEGGALEEGILISPLNY